MYPNYQSHYPGRLVPSTASRIISQKPFFFLQDDALFANLTVRETFWFAAELRLPRKTPTETKRQVVQSIIMAMGLTKAADTYIGAVADSACCSGC